MKLLTLALLLIVGCGKPLPLPDAPEVGAVRTFETDWDEGKITTQEYRSTIVTYEVTAKTTDSRGSLQRALNGCLDQKVSPCYIELSDGHGNDYDISIYHRKGKP